MGRYSIVEFFFQCKTVAGARRNGTNHVLSPNEDSGTFIVLCNPYSEGQNLESDQQEKEEERETIL